jgi:hypothetical protein
MVGHPTKAQQAAANLSAAGGRKPTAQRTNRIRHLPPPEVGPEVVECSMNSL